MLSPSSLMRRPAILLFGLVTLALLCCAYIAFGLTLTAGASSSAGDTHTSKLIAQTAPLECLAAKPVVSKAPPSLNFCSPMYNGNVEGPYGSRIVLVGENLPGTPKAWLLLPANTKLDPVAVQTCLGQLNPACKVLPTPQTDTTEPSVTLFSWLWNGPQFPSSPRLANYSFIAVFGATPTIVETSPIQQTSPNVAFTLLSTQPPCITISSNNSITCTHQQNTALSNGATFTINGANWLPGDIQTVVVTATCAPSSHCSPQQHFQYTLQPNTSGEFHQQERLPTGITGKYTICATNQVQTMVTPGVDTNTIANGALTFGCMTNADTLILGISPPPPPSPIQFGIYDMLSLILMMPALAALVVYLVVRRTGTRETVNANVGTGSSIVDSDKLTPSSTATPPQPTSTQPLVLSPLQQGVIMQGTPQTKYLLTNVFLPNELSTTQIMPKLRQGGITRQDQRDWQTALQKLEQGDPQHAIHSAEKALKTSLEAWDILRQSIDGIQTSNYPQDIEQKAFEALQKALVAPLDKKLIAIEKCSNALVRYLWYLNRSTNVNGIMQTADTWYNIGIAYSILAVALPQHIGNTHAFSALANFERALKIYEVNDIPLPQVSTLHNIGNIHLNNHLLQGIEKVAAIANAISYYERVLQLCTPARFPTMPEVWIATNHHLGKAYFALPGGDRYAHLQSAIYYYQDAYRRCDNCTPKYPATKKINIQHDLTVAQDALKTIIQGSGNQSQTRK